MAEAKRARNPKAGQRPKTTAAKKKASAKRKPAAKKPAPRKAASARPKTTARSRAAAGSAGAAPSPGAAGARQEAPTGDQPHSQTAAEKIEAKIAGLLETADAHDFTDKLWRLLAMIAFAFIGYWVFIAVVILAAMQWVVVLLGEKPSPEIGHYMGRCSTYVRQVLDLLSYRSETLPWPLGSLPGADADS